ncbi:hypothetical protein [Tetzosporium hominis]|uniref:hypothetical protein n=1 Tax=Tetzosporium hominis TaxID=2020506 RepID=UPI0013FD2E51|nr:hypothetical protein [Tetzosporium hominis]
MKQLHEKLVHFFISEKPESVHKSDQLWFFGPIALMMLIVMIVMVSSLVTGV